MSDVPLIQHWLVSVAVAAELPDADQLAVASDADTTGAWDLVAMTTGVSPGELAAQVAKHYRLEVADLDAADPHAHRIIPGRVARKLGVMPLRYSDRLLMVATADPVSMEAERQLAHVASRTIHFEVAPPAAIAEAVEAAYPPDEPLHELPPLKRQATAGPHVLVVDDDPGTRLLFRTLLEERDFRVSEAADGPEALEAIASDDSIDVVTLDLNMPEMPGLDVLKTIRHRSTTLDLPVIVATASDNPEVEMELFEAGADDFVVKPVDPPRFILRIQAVLRRRSSRPLEGLFF